MKLKLMNAVEWALAILLLLAAVAFIFVVTTSHAGTIGDETIAQYRTWPEALKTGYVSGVMASLVRHGNVQCSNPPTVGVMMAWLESDAVKVTETIADAILEIDVLRHGCQAVPRNPKPSA